MKLSDKFLEHYQINDPLPDGVSQEEFFDQMMDYLDRKHLTPEGYYQHTGGGRTTTK